MGPHMDQSLDELMVQVLINQLTTDKLDIQRIHGLRKRKKLFTNNSPYKYNPSLKQCCIFTRPFCPSPQAYQKSLPAKDPSGPTLPELSFIEIGILGSLFCCCCFWFSSCKCCPLQIKTIVKILNEIESVTLMFGLKP